MPRLPRENRVLRSRQIVEKKNNSADGFWGRWRLERRRLLVDSEATSTMSADRSQGNLVTPIQSGRSPEPAIPVHYARGNLGGPRERLR